MPDRPSDLLPHSPSPASVPQGFSRSPWPRPRGFSRSPPVFIPEVSTHFDLCDRHHHRTASIGSEAPLGLWRRGFEGAPGLWHRQFGTPLPSWERALHPTSVGPEHFPTVGVRHGRDCSDPNHIESFVRKAAHGTCPGCPEASLSGSERKPTRQGSGRAAERAGNGTRVRFPGARRPAAEPQSRRLIRIAQAMRR
jgi:hypothetical protein